MPGERRTGSVRPTSAADREGKNQEWSVGVMGVLRESGMYSYNAWRPDRWNPIRDASPSLSLTY